MIKISRSFSLNELACPCCGACEMHPVLLTRLQALRDILDRPLIVNSAYRCEAHNRHVDGRETSQHLVGRAIDVSTSGWSDTEKERLYTLAESLEFGGFGKYENFVHLDVREGKKARWVGDGKPKHFSRRVVDESQPPLKELIEILAIENERILKMIERTDSLLAAMRS